MKRVILLVIDGLGIGAMDDVAETRKQDLGANSLGNVLRINPKLKLSTLEALGFISLLQNDFHGRYFKDFTISLGKNRLAHAGADTYWGHQEIAGSVPKKPKHQHVHEQKEKLVQSLHRFHYSVRERCHCLVVNDEIVISDNIEADLGLNINVIGSLDRVSFEDIVAIARIIRSELKVGRIISQGGRGLSLETMLSEVEKVTHQQESSWGVNVVKLEIYDEHFRSLHLGFGVVPETQMPTILAAHGNPVILIGKAADVVSCQNAYIKPMVNTDNIFDLLTESLNDFKEGLIFANIQEVDLAGHSQNSHRHAELLGRIDRRFPEILERLAADDLFFITADHGNDPTIGHSQHTREHTPLIVMGKNIKPADLGVRSTLSDMAATICEYFCCPLPQNGISFLTKIID